VFIYTQLLNKRVRKSQSLRCLRKLRDGTFELNLFRSCVHVNPIWVYAFVLGFFLPLLLQEASLSPEEVRTRGVVVVLETLDMGFFYALQ